MKRATTALPCRISPRLFTSPRRVFPLVSPRLAAFALLGIINWLYQWYDVGGPIKEKELAQTYVDFFFRGLVGGQQL